MIVCSKCSVTYEHYGQRSAMCRDCKRRYDRQYHRKRSDAAKVRKKELADLRIKENRMRLWEFYKENPCTECGEERVACLQLDHIDPKEKTNNVSNMMSLSWGSIEREINKCRVLCANCHAVHTAEQLGFYNF